MFGNFSWRLFLAICMGCFLAECLINGDIELWAKVFIFMFSLDTLFMWARQGYDEA